MNTPSDMSPDGAGAAPQRSYWARLTESPMRDLVRGRATGRLDTDFLIDSAALPEPIASRIRRVVRASRLWRLERVDVAKELIAHFRDALAAGAAPDRALADFGDEKQAAKLIRRAKRRQRPLVWHAWRRGLQAVGGLFLLLILSYAYLAARYWSGEPKITHDYLADVNAAARAVHKDQAAWPRYREALLALPRGFEWSKTNNLSAHPGDWDWEPVAQVVRDNQPAIARLRDAALMPGLGFLIGPGPIDPADAALMPEAAGTTDTGNAPWQSTLYTVLLPQVGRLKTAALWLAADARLAVLDQEGERALHDIRAILGVARHARENPFLINDMVFLSIAHLASGIAADALAATPDLWTDDQLRDLAHALAALRDEEFHPRFDGERASFADLVQRVYTDDGHGNGRVVRDWEAALRGLSAEGATGLLGDDGLPSALSHALGPIGLAVLAARRDLVREYDRLMGVVQANAARPMWQREWSPGDLAIEQRTLLARARYSFLDLFFPSFDYVIAQFDLVAMSRDAAMTAIALERFRRDRGRYPDTLAEVAPDFLPAVPLDCYDGAPLRYRAPDASNPTPLLYSVGNDRADNGGRLHLTTDGQPDNENPRRWMPPGGTPAGADGRPASQRPAVGSDWILHPPVRAPTKKAPATEDEEAG